MASHMCGIYSIQLFIKYNPFHRFLKIFRFHTSRKDGSDIHAYGIPDEIISAIMIEYKNTKSIVRIDDGDLTL